ncbi:MAG: 4Fe-4S dicluster domain-containing protein [Candidatus Cloacimonetes bacterium]|nr:4Fe-4S dicluster domain-containing protein [Candidatus Cloacimonadota bacterium]
METIKLSEMDSNFKYEIASQPGAENFKKCFTCGTCTASCPVAEVNEKYDPRKIIRMAILGMREQVLSSDLLWMCSRCYTCYALCPQNVKFTDVMEVLRDMAVKEGYVPDNRISEIKELDKFIQDLRCNLINYKLHPDDELANKIRHMLEDNMVKKVNNI